MCRNLTGTDRERQVIHVKEVFVILCKLKLKVCVCTSLFSAIFEKGDSICDFLYASLEDETFQKGSIF